MAIEYTETTVFNVRAQTVVNTVNCVGVMGAGLALEFKLRFPEMHEDYVQRCKRNEVRIGNPYIYTGCGAPWIINFPTKKHWKEPSRIEWVREGLKFFVANIGQMGIESIAFPRLGCSLGNLDWDDIRPIMEEYLGETTIPVFICLDTEPESRGIERLMVDRLNSSTKQIMTSEWRIRKGIATNISTHTIRRFRELGRIKGVGGKTYETLFTALYQLVTTNKGAPEAIQQLLPNSNDRPGSSATREPDKTVDPIVRFMNEATTQVLVDKTRIRKDIAEKIIAARPITEFAELTRIKGVGPETIEKLKKLEKLEELIQLPLPKLFC
ncbi:MAG: macro domain-containing protein [Chloroflexi bacterium]|nr:macro domain-containing protein [Chloroflexota bacterium]